MPVWNDRNRIQPPMDCPESTKKGSRKLMKRTGLINSTGFIFIRAEL